MDPHPDFAQVDLPRQVDLGAFRLTPLTPDQLDEDFAAVTASAPVLQGLFGDDWPAGLTRADNLLDLAWHAREFTLRRSFSWIARDETGQYLGCVYLFPDPGARGGATVVTWIRDRPDRQAMGDALKAACRDWLGAVLPSRITLRWVG